MLQAHPLNSKLDKKEKKDNFLTKAWSYITWGCKKFYRRIHKFITWFPVLWEDEDWDTSYFFIVINTKLKTMEQYFNRSLILHPVALKEIREGIRETKDCFERLLKNDYTRKEWEQHNKKFGKLEMYFAPYKNSKSYSEVLFKPNSKAAEAFRRRIHKLENERYVKDLNTAFENLKTKSYKWWD